MVPNTSDPLQTLNPLGICVSDSSQDFAAKKTP